MLMKTIFFICFAPIALIMFFVMRNEAKPKKNLILGVTLPLTAREGSQVRTVVKGYLKKQSIMALILLILLVPQFFFSYTSVVMTWYFSWLLIAIIAPAIPYVMANRALKKLKVQNGWTSNASGIKLVDLTVAAAPKKKLSIWFFAPAFLLTLVPLVHTVLTLRGRDAFLPMLLVYLIFSATAGGFYFLYRIFFRQRSEVVDDNTSVNAALTQIRRYNWNKIWLLITWMTAFFDVTFWLFSGNVLVILSLSILYTLVLLLFAIQAEFKTRTLQEKLTAESGRSLYIDDDDNWLFGMLYNNPDDTHFMVNKRTGVGTTINLAKTSAKVFMVFVVLILLSMPFVGVWLMNEEFTPVRLEAGAQSITARHTAVVYELPYSDIQSAYLLDTLPQGNRTMGTAMDTVLKGRFNLTGIGTCRLSLDPQVSPFLVIETTDHTYVFGSHQPGEARAVYDMLINRAVIAPAPAA